MRAYPRQLGVVFLLGFGVLADLQHLVLTSSSTVDTAPARNVYTHQQRLLLSLGSPSGSSSLTGAWRIVRRLLLFLADRTSSFEHLARASVANTLGQGYHAFRDHDEAGAGPGVAAERRVRPREVSCQCACVGDVAQ